MRCAALPWTSLLGPQVPLLAGLQAEQYAALAKAFTPLSYRAGSDVVTQGQPGDQFFLLEHGTAQVFKDGRGPLMEYGPNDYFGELALLNQVGQLLHRP